MKKANKKKILFSVFSVPLLASYGTFFVDTSKSSVTEISSDRKVNIEDSSINFEDSFPVANNTITKLSDYIVSYEDNNIYPVNVNNATVGMTKDFTTLTYTTYSGLLLWSSDLTKNELLKKYYSTYLDVTNISSYKVNYFAYQKSTGLLFVLFGSNVKTNQVVFAIDIYTGNINVPLNAMLKNHEVITKVEDDSAFIFFNSSNDVIVTSANTRSEVNRTTKIFKYAKDGKGFADRKVNVSLDTAYSPNHQTLGHTADTDMFLGLVPGKNKINYGLYLHTEKNYKNGTLTIQENSGNKTSITTASFNYYIKPLDDDLKSIPGTDFSIVNGYQPDTANWGYWSENTHTIPKFDEVYKRIYKLENAANQNKTYMFLLIDSYYKTHASYSMFGYEGTQKINDQYTSQGWGGLQPESSNYSGVEKVEASNWNFDSFNYDSKSNLIYYSFSGKKIDQNNNKSLNSYLAKMGYISFETAVLKPYYSDFKTETTPYNIYSVNYDSYTSSNYYMVKQAESANPVWMSKEKFGTVYNETANKEIKFSKLSNFNNLIEQLESNLFPVIPESINQNNLNSLFSLDNGNNLNIKIVSANNASGLIVLRVEVNHKNDFGDDVNNGTTSYVFNVEIKGYSIEKNFLLKFITSDLKNMGFNNKINKINEIKEFTQPSDVSISQIKSYFLDYSILSKNKIYLSIQDDWIKLNANNELGLLTVEVNIPSSLLPDGFPTSLSQIVNVYKDFGVHVDPLPDDSSPDLSDLSSSKNTNLLNKTDAKNIAAVSAGIVAVTVLFITIFLVLLIKNKKQTDKLNSELTIKK